MSNIPEEKFSETIQEVIELEQKLVQEDPEHCEQHKYAVDLLEDVRDMAKFYRA